MWLALELSIQFLLVKLLISLTYGLVRPVKQLSKLTWPKESFSTYKSMLNTAETMCKWCVMTSPDNQSWCYMPTPELVHYT